MKNILLLISFIGLGIFSFINEPISDTADLLSGSSTETYQTQVDVVSGVTERPAGSDSSEPEEPSEPSQPSNPFDFN